MGRGKTRGSSSSVFHKCHGCNLPCKDASPGTMQITLKERGNHVQWKHIGEDCTIQMRPFLGNWKEGARSHIAPVKQAPPESLDIPSALTHPLRQWKMLSFGALRLEFLLSEDGKTWQLLIALTDCSTIYSHYELQIISSSGLGWFCSDATTD